MTIKAYQVEQSGIYVIEFSFAGGSPPSPGTNTGKYGFCHTSGGSYLAGEVYYDSGVALLNMPITKGTQIKLIVTPAGTVSLLKYGLYTACSAVAPYLWTISTDDGDSIVPTNPSQWDDEFLDSAPAAKWTEDKGNNPGQQDRYMSSSYLEIRCFNQGSANLGIASYVLAQNITINQGNSYAIYARIYPMFTEDGQRCGIFISDNSADYANSLWHGFEMNSGLVRARTAKIVSGTQTDLLGSAHMPMPVIQIPAFYLSYSTDHWIGSTYFNGPRHGAGVYPGTSLDPLPFTPTKLGVFGFSNTSVHRCLFTFDWFRVAVS